MNAALILAAYTYCKSRQEDKTLLNYYKALEEDNSQTTNKVFDQVEQLAATFNLKTEKLDKESTTNMSLLN